MNNIITPNSENISDKDAINFYKLISTVTQLELEPKTDKIILKKPERSSQNAKKYFVLCDINKNRRVGIKRCMDNSQYLRREIIINEAKKITGFPTYSILSTKGIILQLESKEKNCIIFENWENKDLIIMDFGNPNDMKTLKELEPNTIDSWTFYYEFGRWAAFNFLLGVIDRHSSNFILSFTDGKIHSIDNELGPFDSKGNEAGPRQILVPVKQTIERFFTDTNRGVCIQNLKQGFVDGWDSIVSKLSQLTMFNKDEMNLIQKRSVHDSKKVSEIFFN